MPQREVFMPPELTCVIELLFGPALLVLLMPASRRPYRVTFDWAWALPAAASTAMAASENAVFFM
ncbi:hypothetical protein D3C87_690700 [compost metagenome]